MKTALRFANIGVCGGGGGMGAMINNNGEFL